MKWFNLIEITVECDNGKIEYLEEKRPMHLSVPYKIGDRIYHIKCSKYTCRFPFNKDKQSHSQTSTVCPLCGANLKLETKECSFCGCELPYDPNLK